ncbi:MAG: hypothetical protein M9944_07880 [Rhizobiaceae bacterium]|nr:hypothetical protein [Rhizobiaceae bacterium]
MALEPMKLEPDLCLVTRDEMKKIKVRTGQLIKLAGGPELFQHSAGVPKDRLSKYSSPSESTVIRLDVALALDRQLEAPMMLSFVAEMLGYRLVPIEGGPEDGDRVTLADLADLHRADGDVTATLSDALTDGVIDIGERRQTRASISRKVQLLKRLDRKLARGG